MAIKSIATKLILLSALFVCSPTTSSFAGSFFAGGGLIQRYIAGDGKISWSAVLTISPVGDTTISQIFEPFDITNSMTFSPEIGIAAGGVNGLGWNTSRSKAIKTFVGFRISKPLALTLSVQIPFTHTSMHRESGFDGPTLFYSDILAALRQSAMALEARVYPIGESLFLSAGVERTTAKLQLTAVEIVPVVGVAVGLNYPTNDSFTSIKPVIGAGYEYYFLDFLGILAHATYSFTDYKNFTPESELSAYPWLEFDNGGFGIFLSTTFRTGFVRW